ncbi:MAG TPA: hypothetical protein VFJ98_00875 [Mycobacteriales bacterium]|nr:hypothetical protein [Mycobacteriales bacterium]
MDLETLQRQPRLLMRQKLTLMVNRYVVTVEAPGGGEGEVVAFAEQKRMAFREEVTMYTDESRRAVVCRFKARQILDVGAAYDVWDHTGTPIGMFRKDFAKSLLRSTWHLEQQGITAVGQERSPAVAIIRRVWEMVSDIPFFVPYHFDFTAGDRQVLSVDKTTNFRDRYAITMHDPTLDRRLAIAVAVALDALQSR